MTELETQIMEWLGKVGKPVSFSRLQEDGQIKASNEDLGKALGSLGRRSLLEKVKEDRETMFDIQPVVRKYVKAKSSNYGGEKILS